MKTGKSAIANRTRPARSAYRPSGGIRKGYLVLRQRTTLLTLALLVVGALAAWWRNEKLQVGYCTVGRPGWSLSGRVPEWVDHTIAPRCETCPRHASCHPQSRVTCDEDFLMRPHPWSVGGLVPLPPRCEGARGRPLQVQKLAAQTVAELRSRQSAWRRSQKDDDWIRALPSENELKTTILGRNRSVYNASTADALWQDALQEGMDRKEIRRLPFGPTPSLTRFSAAATSPPWPGVLWPWLHQPVSVVLRAILFSALLYVWDRRRDTARLEHLVALTVDRLREQATRTMSVQEQPRPVLVRRLIDQICVGQPHRLIDRWKASLRQNQNIRCLWEGDAEAWEWVGTPASSLNAIRDRVPPPVEGLRRSRRVQDRGMCSGQ